MPIFPISLTATVALAMSPSAPATPSRGASCPAASIAFAPAITTSAASVSPAHVTNGDVHRVVCRFHVIRRSDGTGGIDEERIPDMMRDLNYGFRDTAFVFAREPGVVYIDNDTYYADFPDFTSMIPVWNAYYEPGVLNWFLTPLVQSGQFDATTSFGPPVTSGQRGIFMAYDATGTPTNIVTPTHETGHIFALNHPGETFFGAECTSGTNCASAGDLVCDTPASPNVFGANTTATGIYFANEPGPCGGDPPYDPNTRLYMEFGWPAGHILRNRFTDGQRARMDWGLANFQSDLVGPARPDVLVDCDGDGLDDLQATRDGVVADLNRDGVPDACQTFPEAGDLLVCGMVPDDRNRPRYYDIATGTVRGAIWNGYDWTHQLRAGPDGLIYMPRLTLVARLDPRTGRTHDNFIDDVLEGASVLVDVAFAPDGAVLTLDNVSARIRKHDPVDGSFLGDLANLGAIGMTSPKAMAIGPDGLLHIVGNGTLGNTIPRLDPVSGASAGSLIGPGAGGLVAGQGLLFAGDDVYVSDGGTHAVRRYDAATGAFIDAFVSPGSGGLSSPHGLAFGPGGGLHVASRNTNSVKRYDGTTGVYRGDSVPPGADGLLQPAGVLFIDERCPPDLDHDDTVGFGDLLAILSAWGPCPAEGACPEDLAPGGGNGVVGFEDILVVLAQWGPCP